MGSRRVVGSRRVRVEVWSEGAKQCDADLDLMKLAVADGSTDAGASGAGASGAGASEFHGTLHADRVLLIDLAGAGTLTFRAQGRECEGFLTDSTSGRIAFSTDVPFDL